MARSAPGPLIVTRWARQDRRAPAALAPGFAKLDDRCLTQLLAEAAHFARHVRYIDRSGAVAGDWGDILETDPAVFLALVTTFEFEEHAAAIRRQLRRLRSNDKLAVRERALRNVEEHVLHLARSVDRWIGTASGDRAARGGEAGEAIRISVEEWLAPHLRRFHGFLAAIEAGGFVEDRFAVLVYPFHPGWRLSDSDAMVLAWDVERLWLDYVAEPLAESVEAFLAGMEKLQARGAEALEARLADSTHAPHVGLLLAFLKLFGHEQDRLNAILPRLASHFFEDMVGAVPRPAVPDATFLALTRTSAEGPAPRIAAGHVFEARPGKAAVAARFAADFALTVTGTKVEELRLWQAAPGRVGLERRVEPGEPELAEAFAAAADSALPAAPVGFIVAGRAMRAASGTRRFRIALDLTGLAWPDGAPQTDFPILLASAFKPAILTGEGWLDLETVQAEGALAGDGRASVSFSFALAANAPPVAYDAPAVRFLLVQDGFPAALAPLAIFAEARVVRATVELEVEDLRGLELSTVSGPAASAIGLAPFGTPAVRGGWTEIGHPALDRGVERIGLTLRWADPPPHSDGFYGYYREYVVDLDRTVSRRGVPLFRNDVFRVSLEYEGGRGAIADLPLFPSAAPFGPVEPLSAFELRSTGAEESAPIAAPGRIRMTLTAPDHAFGDLLYQSNILYANQLAAGRVRDKRRRHALLEVPAKVGGKIQGLIEADERLWQGIRRRWREAWESVLLIEDSSRGEEPAPEPAPAPVPIAPRPLPPVEGMMPNPPWRPTLAGLRLDYRASFELNAREPGGADIDIGHWTPLGEAVATPWAEGTPLLPQLPQRPCFDLTLSQSSGGDGLTLLFVVDAASESPPVDWLAQEDDSAPWRPAEILDDRTQGLTRSGLLRLTRSPLRLRAASTGPLPRVRAVLPDALSATRILSGADDPVEPVPRGSITKISGARGVGGVRQPCGSFGGSGGGDRGSVAIRAGERLRHRQRAILAWDDERLVLDRFPQIDRIRILPARGRDGASRPGSLLAVVVPVEAEATAREPGRPAAASWLLREIEAELSTRGPMSASIAAVSPAYAPVDVRVKAALAGSGDGARLDGDIRDFLSPCGADGPDLADDADIADLATSLLRFIRGRPYVLAVANVAATLRPGAEAEPWIVPVAGEVEIEVLTLESFGA